MLMAGQVPITVAFGVEHLDLTDAADLDAMEINIESGVVRVAIGDYGGDSVGGSVGNSMAVHLAVSVQDAFGVRCHGASDTAAAAGETELYLMRLCATVLAGCLAVATD